MAEKERLESQESKISRQIDSYFKSQPEMAEYFETTVFIPEQIMLLAKNIALHDRQNNPFELGRTVVGFYDGSDKYSYLLKESDGTNALLSRKSEDGREIQKTVKLSELVNVNFVREIVGELFVRNSQKIKRASKVKEN